MRGKERDGRMSGGGGGGGADRNRKRLKQAADREQRLKGRMEDERERVRHSKEGDYLSQGGRQ